MKQRDDLLKLKESIEYMFDTGNLGVLTPQEANEVLYIYANDILMNKAGETISKKVAYYFSRFNFIEIKQSGIGWRISYRG